ncbi:hypothetical protein N7532_004964 [Penicillium argentinense]|uniref:Uncharacterized protein n=1 Tax=Penicillium argentinense TaxID=1131581 RepID=A0A9W9K9H1_9EURO|nr:uncharacterized protein N7532_004964 [Penicillium argentinense]KAJ5097963.1 hypothetical protein N7532_004964 [Penicillium argentinense]
MSMAGALKTAFAFCAAPYLQSGRSFQNVLFCPFVSPRLTGWSGLPSLPGTLTKTIKLATLLPEIGDDILDVSWGGITESQRIEITPTYQLDLALTIRQAILKAKGNLFVAAVGHITSPEVASNTVQDDEAEFYDPVL